MVSHLNELGAAFTSATSVLFTGTLSGMVDKKYLKEYRCPACKKLLAKGTLSSNEDLLEVKCRGCSTICIFKGEDAEIVKERSRLLKKGIIPDSDLKK